MEKILKRENEQCSTLKDNKILFSLKTTIEVPLSVFCRLFICAERKCNIARVMPERVVVQERRKKNQDAVLINFVNNICIFSITIIRFDTNIKNKFLLQI